MNIWNYIKIINHTAYVQMLNMIASSVSNFNGFSVVQYDPKQVVYAGTGILVGMIQRVSNRMSNIVYCNYHVRNDTVDILIHILNLYNRMQWN